MEDTPDLKRGFLKRRLGAEEEKQKNAKVKRQTTESSGVVSYAPIGVDGDDISDDDEISVISIKDVLIDNKQAKEPGVVDISADDNLIVDISDDDSVVDISDHNSTANISDDDDDISVLHIQEPAYDHHPQSPFLLLPDEIIVHILKFLTRQDVLNRISLVNKRFRDLNFVAKPWQSLNIPPPTEINSENSALRLLDQCSWSLKHLSMERRAFDDLANHALNSCLKLESLSISCDAHGFLKAAGSVENAPLRRISTTGALNFADLRCNRRCLRNLTHISVVEIDAECLKMVARVCKCLEHFQFKSAVTDDVMSYFLSQVGATIKSLGFNGNQLTDDSYVNLGHCRQIRSLEISSAPAMKRPGLLAVLDLTELNSLLISQVWFLESIDYTVAFGVRCLHKLATLSLSSLRLDDLAMRVISRNCPNLTSLNLSCCHFTDVGLKAVANNCRTLQSFVNCDSGVDFSSGAISYFLRKLKDTISCFLIIGFKFGSKAAESLQKCRLMERFALKSADKLKGKDLQLITRVKTLKHLGVPNSKLVTSRDFVRAFSAKKLQQLTHLDLSGCSFLDDQALIQIADCCPNLLLLNVSGCRNVTAVAIRYLLIQCQSLKVLDIRELCFMPLDTFRHVKARLCKLCVSAEERYDSIYSVQMQEMMTEIVVLWYN